MSTTKTINLDIIHTYILHQQVYETGHTFSDVDREDPAELTADVTFNYDYERLPNDEWLFHADGAVRVVPYGKLLIRNTFRGTATADELFSRPIIKVIIETALKKTSSLFIDFSNKNNFPDISKIHITQHMIAGLVKTVIDSYALRSKDDADNHFLATAHGLHLTPGGNTALILKGTFMIMDHLLYENPAFDGEHNRNVLMNYVPLTRYETVKWKCIQIDEQDVQLTWVETIFFFHCVDCALQILLGDHADKITASIEKFGMSELRRKEYISFSTEMVESLKKRLKEGKMTISNLEQQIDWNNLIK